jgi:hypothetical protein
VRADLLLKFLVSTRPPPSRSLSLISSPTAVLGRLGELSRVSLPLFPLLTPVFSPPRWGCGLHIPSVMDRLALIEQCDCEEHTPLPPGVGPERMPDTKPGPLKRKPRWPKRGAVGGAAGTEVLSRDVDALVSFKSRRRS